MPVRTQATISDGVMRAILAMDSYNRGFRPGLDIVTKSKVAGVDLELGNASIVRDSAVLFGDGVARRTGFSATAYNWNGQTVISYRGTDYDSDVGQTDFLSQLASADIWSGWTIGAGYAGADQAQLALRFYRAVAGVNSVYAAAPDITLVGHSLGGGLAGFVGALSQQPVYGYDHMPFGAAAYAQAISDSARAAANRLGLDWGDVAATISGISSPTGIISGAITFATFMAEFERQYARRAPVLQNAGYHIDGEILELVRSGTVQSLVGAGGTFAALLQGGAPGLPGFAIEAMLAVAGFGLGYSVAQFEQAPNMGSSAYAAYATGTAPYSENLTAVERHSMAYLATVIYGVEQLPLERPDITAANWSRGFTYVAPGLFEAEIGLSVGLRRNAANASEPENQMAMMIAYSAIDEGVRPFGDTAILSLFDDSNDLGIALGMAGAPTTLAAGGNGIGNLVAEFAAFLASESIVEAGRPSAIEGILTYRDATAARSATLMIDLRQAITWNNNSVNHSIVSTDNMIEGFIQADVNEGRQILNRIERFYANANGGQDLMAAIDRVSISLGGTLPVARLAGDGVLLTVLSDSGGTSSFTGQTDFVFGGEGVDILSGMGGEDILIGGRGDDRLDGGNARDFLYGGTGQDILRGGEGGDELWSGPARDANGVAWRDQLYGEGGNDLLNFSNGAGVAVGGLDNDVIDARLAAETIEVQYSIGDGTDRLMYTEIDRALLNFASVWDFERRPTAGRVGIKFTDLSLDDVIIRWEVEVVDTQASTILTGWTDRLCVGVMRVLARDGTELINLGEVSGIVTQFVLDFNWAAYFAALNHPLLEFTDGEFGAGEGANAEFQIVAAVTPPPPEPAIPDVGASQFSGAFGLATDEPDPFLAGQLWQPMRLVEDLSSVSYY